MQDIHIPGSDSMSIYEPQTKTFDISLPPNSDALVILKYFHEPAINYEYTITKNNSDQAYIDAFKSLLMQLPGYELALANADL